MSKTRIACHAALFGLYACTSSSATPPPAGADAGGSSGVSQGGSTNGGGSSSAASSSTASTGTSSAAGSTASDGGGGDGGTNGDGGVSCSSLPLCDDFESDTVGQPPNSALWITYGLAGCSGMGNPDAPAVFSITVDDTEAFSGTKSVKIDTSQASAGAGCGPWLVNTSAFPQLTGGDLYGRFYVHLSDTTMTVDHVAMMALGLQTDGGIGFDVQNADSFLSMASLADGFTTNSLAWTRSDANGTLPPQGTTGESTYPSATGFTCIEFHTSAGTSAIQTWVNGTLLSGLTDPPPPAGLTTWNPPSPLAATSFGLGWQIYSGPNLTVWVDDVALATSRIGCE